MEYRIDLEKQNKRNDQVTELILDNCRASQISGLTEEFSNLEMLSLINVGLTTLKGFPKLPRLKKLELSDNRLTGGLNLLHGSPKLQHLNISGNRIKDFEALEPLKEFHDLVSLDLYNCEITKADEYRKKVFDLLPSLKALDGYDREDREVADSDEDDEDGSDVENHITREDNDSADEDGQEAVDDDAEDEGDDDDDDEEDDGSYDESYDEIEDKFPSGKRIDPNPGADSDEGDYDEEDDGDDDEDDDDDDDDIRNEEESIEQNSNGDLAAVNSEHNQMSNNLTDDQEPFGVDDDEDDEDEDDDEDDDDEDEDEDEDIEADLKILQQESYVEDAEDEDFEPTHEPDERDHEIDPEDASEEDEEVDGDTSGNQVASSVMETATEMNEADVAVVDKRGQKRKLEDEGGDEPAEEETAPSGQE